MMLGLGSIYFLVIVVANSLGAVSGMGGGVLIKPIFDLVGQDSVATISFYSTVAVFTMSVVSTWKQARNGVHLHLKTIAWIAVGAIGGGTCGKLLLSWCLYQWHDRTVLGTQIVLTIITIGFAFLDTRFAWRSWRLSGWLWAFACGVILGFFASYLGIGGGPINVALLMLMFDMPIKEATVYSIATIFCSQGAKLLSIVTAGELQAHDLRFLWFIIPAAIVGGFVGSHLSKILSSRYVTVIFQWMLLVVICINAYNGIQLLLH